MLIIKYLFCCCLFINCSFAAEISSLEDHSTFRTRELNPHKKIGSKSNFFKLGATVLLLTGRHVTAYGENVINNHPTRKIHSLVSYDFSNSIRAEFIRDICFRGKLYEGRLDEEKYKNYVEGKKVKWISTENDESVSVVTEITRRDKFVDFKTMLEKNGWQKFLPRAICLEDAIDTYHSFPGYAEKVKKHGVLALKIKVISHDLSDEEKDKEVGND